MALLKKKKDDASSFVGVAIQLDCVLEEQGFQKIRCDVLPKVQEVLRNASRGLLLDMQQYFGLLAKLFHAFCTKKAMFTCLRCLRCVA